MIYWDIYGGIHYAPLYIFFSFIVTLKSSTVANEHFFKRKKERRKKERKKKERNEEGREGDRPYTTQYW